MHQVSAYKKKPQKSKKTHQKNPKTQPKLKRWGEEKGRDKMIFQRNK